MACVAKSVVYHGALFTFKPVKNTGLKTAFTLSMGVIEA
jgi:hypothetical protein